jgi:hypothetical protein
MKRPQPRARPERIAWFEGSRLTRRDLADAIEHEARMLELHVRAAHDTEGIASGLTTSLSADRRTVTVQPGLAYSCRGASVLLHAPASIAAPPASMKGTRFDLVLADATLRWSAADDASGCDCAVPGDAIHLGRFTRTSSGTLVGPDNQRRRAVRGLVRPHVASGVTAPGALLWQQGVADLHARIDTSAAGFTTTPVYLASIASPSPWTGNLVAPFISVGQGTPTHFDVHVLIAAKSPALVLLFAQLAVVKELAISWTGVESAVGCSGGPSLSAVLLPGITTGVFT